MTAHARTSASSMHRWAACPGSVALIDRAPPAVSSGYAEEGSDAHAYAAFVLTRKSKSCKPADIGQTIEFDGRKFTVTEDMAEAVGVYVEHVNALRVTPLARVHVEKKFDLSKIHPGCFGTADCVIWLEAANTLHVIDYKHGAGVPVDATANPQLQYYALGAMLDLGYPAEKVVITVVQPRCNHPGGPVRSWEIDAFDLLQFASELKRYAEATEKPDAPLNPGDHCRFCPASVICPALETKAKAVAQAEFGPVGSAIDHAKLAEALTALDLIESRGKMIRELAYAEAERGAKIPGWKLVEKVPRRKWRDEAEAGLALEAVAAEDQVYEYKLRSPAQMEKIVGKDVVAPLVVKESSGLALVAEHDKRPAINRGAGADFDLTNIPDFLRRGPTGERTVTA